MLLASVLATLAFFVPATSAHGGERLPKADLDFLRDMTRDVIEASRVKPGSNGGGSWQLTNVFSFALIAPGQRNYTAFWPRDFSMSVDSGFITPSELSNHLWVACLAQNGPTDRKLAHGLHIPPWAIPDHVNYNGRPAYYPGTYAWGEDQGTGGNGRVPPIDDHYEIVHIAYTYWKASGDADFLKREVNGLSVFERLEKAFTSPTTDPETGLDFTTESDRAVGFGFCDGETHTGKLLFASLLRYRAAGELAELSRAVGQRERAPAYRKIQKTIRANIVPTFGDPEAIGGWLRASTEISRQPDVWGTLFALHLDILSRADAKAARKTIADAVRRGTITLEGGVRHVPSDHDFSKTTAWERSSCPVNTYQNGGYWHTATGWLVEALWPADRKLALRVFGEMIAHLREQDFRKGPGHGAPWEVFGPNGKARQHAVYMTSVALPYGILKRLQPAETERELVRDPHFQHGFRLFEPKPGKLVVYGEATDSASSAKPVWDLCQWSSKFPLEAVRTKRSTNGFLCFTNIAKRVCAGPLGSPDADLSLAVNASVEYGNRARQTPADPWVHLLLQQEIENPPSLADLAACDFHIEARLKHSKLHRTDDYTPGRHAAQFQVFLSVANRNPKSPGYRQYVWFGIPIYDDRSRMPPEYKAHDVADTKMFINTVASDAFTKESTHDGKWVTFERDLLPLMREALETAWKRGSLTGSREPADFRVAAVFVGWEVPGIFDVEIQVRNLSLKAHHRTTTEDQRQ